MADDSHIEDTDPHEDFLRLWTRHESELRAFVRSCCPRAEEVDEVMQDVSIAAWRKFSTLDDHGAFGRWASMIARYEILMTRRRAARDRLVLSDDVIERLAEEGAEELPLRNKQLEALEGCISKLSPDQRELALAAYARENTMRDLADQLDRTEGAIYQLLFRIRRKLQTCIERSLARKTT
ncbi:MAG: sigma-70 family RNA polymerase sigma factor [Verrucomicrobiota bacterium]